MSASKPNLLERKERARLLRQEQFTKARTEDAALRERLDETVCLAVLRGEQVESGHGKTRIRSRDGLRSLLDGGQLDHSEYDAGLYFRLCFETLNAGPRSNLNRDIRGGNGHFAETRAFRAMRLSEMEGMADRRREWPMLRYVAGEGRAARALSKGGADYNLNVKALKVVLGEIADRYKLRFAA
jgi:hypothetical protein